MIDKWWFGLPVILRVSVYIVIFIAIWAFWFVPIPDRVAKADYTDTASLRDSLEHMPLHELVGSTVDVPIQRIERHPSMGMVIWLDHDIVIIAVEEPKQEDRIHFELDDAAVLYGVWYLGYLEI